MKPNDKFIIAASQYRQATLDLKKILRFGRAGIREVYVFNPAAQFTISPDKTIQVDKMGLAFICTPSLSQSVNERRN